MVWLLSFCTGLIAAAAGAFAAGAVAAGCVEWYRISPREGGSGYFVLFIGLMGLVAGFIIGCICGGVLQADSMLGYGKAVGLAVAVILLLAAPAALLCRLLADIPPTIGGDELFLLVEVRLPADHATHPALELGKASLYLGSIPHGSRTVRKGKTGPMWVDDAVQVEGRWIVRGAVSLFTRRGKMMIVPTIGDRLHEGFDVPLPANPGEKYESWSDWLPRTRPDAKPLNRLTYRFRVQRTSAPMRTETVGDFEIDTVTSGFYDELTDGQYHIASIDTFRVRYHGRPIDFGEPLATSLQGGGEYPVMNSVATFPSEPAATVVHVQKNQGGHAFFLLTAAGDAARAQEIAAGYSICNVRSPSADGPVPAPGRYVSPNRRRLAGGLYRVGYNGVLDTERLAIYRFTQPEKIYESDGVQPIGLSPDQRSFVRPAPMHETPGEKPLTVLAVTDFVGDRTYLLRIDRQRMHYTRAEELNEAWVAHHFEWRADASGINQLAERAAFAPLPYRGEYKPDYGGCPCYRIDGVNEPMRAALEAFVTDRFHAIRQPGEASDYEHTFLIEAKPAKIACGGDSSYVMLTFGSSFDRAVAQTIAAGFDAELATGQYDGLFQTASPRTSAHKKTRLSTG